MAAYPIRHPVNLPMSKQAVLRVVLTLVMIAFALLGVINAYDDWDVSKTEWQKAVTTSTCLYGVTSFVAAVGLWFRKRWALWPTLLSAVFCAFSAGGATRFFGETDIITALVAATSTMLVTVPIIWLTYWLTRIAPASPKDSSH